MTAPLIFLSKLAPQGPALLSDDATHHLRVRRQLIDGQSMILSDGDHYTHAILRLEKKKCWGDYTEILCCPKRPSQLNLYLSLIKPEPLAWAVQKATEMGVESIHLVSAKRSQKNYWTTKSYEHLQKVIISACEQSGQYRPPRLTEPCPLNSLNFTPDKTWIYAQLPEGNNHADSLTIPSNKPICYLIGPEGGWDVEEEGLLSLNAQKISLPGPVLRAETAALACTALLLWGGL